MKDELNEQSSLKMLQLTVDFYIQIRGLSFAQNVKQKFKVLSKEKNKKKGRFEERTTEGFRSISFHLKEFKKS